MAFPKILDMYEFCTDDLKKALDPGRAEETRQIEEETKRMLDNRGKEHDKEEEKVRLLAKEDKKEEKETTVSDDILNLPFGWLHVSPLGSGLDNGKYHLVGVITHKGRYADSGHYVGWSYYKQSSLYLSATLCRHLAQVR